MKIILALILFIILANIISFITSDGGEIVGAIFLIVVLFLLCRWMFGWLIQIYPGDFGRDFWKASIKVLLIIITLPLRLLAMLLKGL